MSQYKSAIRTQQPPEPVENSKYRTQARQLQELFPSWSNDDLHTLLNEVNGDVQIAATRISDGVAEQWGSVSRKKDKKAPTSAHASKESFSSRGDFRGGRGGRGGRGSSGRGGVARGRGGPPRGGAINGRSSRTESPHPNHVDVVLSTEVNDASAGEISSKPISGDSVAQQNGLASSAHGWSDSHSHLETTTPTGSSWGGASTTSTWGGDTDINGSSVSVNMPSNKLSSKSPATSKLSWAQIARPQERPAAPPTPAVAPNTNVQIHATTSSAPITTPTPVLPLALESESQNENWEDPTTVQPPPTWDDEPQVKPPAPNDTTDKSEDTQDESETEASIQPQKEVETDPPSESTPQEPPTEIPTSKSEPAPSAPLVTPVLSQAPTSTPSPKLSARPAASSHRNSARYKTIDQPVVMPSSFGSGIEKVGMQFGSLSLVGESLFDSDPSELEAATAPEPSSPPQVQAPVQPEQSTPPPPATAPASTSLGPSMFQQQSLPQQSLPQQAQPSLTQPATHHAIPQSIPQQSQQVQASAAHAAAAASPLQQYAQQHQAQAHQQQAQHQAQQHSLTTTHQHQHQHQQHQPQHPQQSHNQYVQHTLPAHIDPSQQIQSPTHQQPQNAPSHSNYFGRGEPAAGAYFHTPTPPAAQAQDNPYGAFGQLGVQAQHQQGSHLGGFASAEYGYGDNQRGFYDNYGQQSGFSNRNVLGHEDVKGLPGTQQAPTNVAIPPSSAQPSQPHASLQGSTQPQPTGAQAPQQGYPMPYPYYSYPQSQQFYGYGPNYGQPFKYPAMFQAPPGPGSAPSPVGKQPGAGGVGVQPQTNPYSQGLYPQSGYDDYQPHPHHQQHQQHQQHQHSHSLGLGQAGVGGDYSKQLYGGTGQGAMQGFMGLGQAGGQGGVPASNGGGPRGAGSPEAPYKPYAPKDVGVNVPTGRGAVAQQGQGQAQPQAQGQGQGPQGQGFYGGARFGGSTAGGVGAGGPQQNAHHPQGGPQGHLGYPQGSNDGGFYQYQRQQPQYWQ